MDLAVALTTVAIIFPAELPDKTALASLVLGTKYRPVWVFGGSAAAFALHVVLAVAAGSMLTLLPQRAVEGVVGGLFLLGAVLLLRGRHTAQPAEKIEDAPPRDPLRVAFTSFGIVLVAEFGDLTQIVTANLAAKYHDPLSVGVGSVLALWAVCALAAFGGERVARLLPITWIVRAAALAMAVLGALSLVRAVPG